jgi:hypothetical protein
MYYLIGIIGNRVIERILINRNFLLESLVSLQIKAALKDVKKNELIMIIHAIR